MPGRIPENILEDILSRINIVDVISGYIPLKKAGRNFRANCPFHHEKTPSFMVSPDRQIYHCFGCSAGGNAFNFLMQYERLDFPEAVEILAKKAGVLLPQLRQDDPKTQSLSTQLYKINELAALFYAQNLNAPSQAVKKNYLFKRGLKEETIQAFKLGSAPEAWEALINHLRQKGMSLGLIEKAGLAVAKDSGGYYDRFRGRIIFPVFDVRDRILGFGARVLDNSLPKYINSPETALYTKGKNLYGLNFARDAIRQADSVAIVEGYLDFILPFQAGVQNIVASLGTALTQEQARLLKRYTHNVVVIYDADKAGELAALRSLDIFIEEEMNVRVVSLPEGLDPDLFVRKYGAEGLKEKISGAQNLFDYKLKILKTRHNISEAEGKAAIAAEMLSTLKKFKNLILQAEYIKRLSEALGVDEHYVIEELRKIKSDRPFQEQNNTAAKKAPSISPTAKLLLNLMLEETSFIDQVKTSLAPEDFQHDCVTRIVSEIFDLVAQNRSITSAQLISRLGDAGISQLVCESAFMPEVSLEEREKIVCDCIQRLKGERSRKERQRLHEEIKFAQHHGDEAGLKRLMHEFHRLIKKE